MVESKNIKLKLGLCGLALTSFLALNSRSVVHADTVSGNNADAITWDSDNDDSQVIKEEPQQDNSSQSAQKQATVQSNVQVKQASATQNVQTQGAVQEQKAPATQSVQPAQKQATAQSHVQVKQFQPKVAVANVSSTPVQQNRAKTSNVRSSSVQRQAVVVQNNADYNETLSSLGPNTNLGDLGVYDVSPDGVKSNIQSQVQSQLAVNDASLANFNMNKDASGNLTASFGVYSNTAKQQNWWTNVKVNNTVVQGIQWRTNVSIASDGNLHLTSTGKQIVYSVSIHKLPGAVIHNPAGNKVTVHFVDLNGKAVGGDYSIDTTKNGDGQYKLANGYQTQNGNTSYNVAYATHTVHHDATGHYEEVQTGYGWFNSGADNESGSMTEDEYNQFINEHGGNSDTGISGDTTTTVSPTYSDEWVEDSPAYDETVVDKDLFTDKSGDVKSATGNVVNVVVTKPQNVDPNSANCKRQAQRVIHITFPNGVKPKSYDSIADSEGNKFTLDGNNDLVQTVTFTRSMTVDGLTGATLTQTSWQQQGAINAVTLPDIPGYTMVTSN